MLTSAATSTTATTAATTPTAVTVEAASTTAAIASHLAETRVNLLLGFGEHADEITSLSTPLVQIPYQYITWLREQP